MFSINKLKKIQINLNEELIEKLNSFFLNDLRKMQNETTIDVSEILYENFENTEYIFDKVGDKKKVKIKSIIEYDNGTFSLEIYDPSSKYKERSISITNLKYFKRL